MKNFQLYLLPVLLFLFGNTINYGQSILKTFPDTLKYETQFERLQQLLIYNDGNANIIIDSIFIDETFYEARFNRALDFPYSLAPGDSLLMDCILWNFWRIPYGDYDNTLIIYSDSQNNIKKINTNVGFEYTASDSGGVEGFVKTGDTPVNDAKIYFYINGIKLIDSAGTNGEGFYSAELLPGNYFISAKKENYNLSFGFNKVSPIDADFISIQKDSVSKIDFNLTTVSATSFSIQGNIFDKQINSLAKKRRGGIVIAREGGHNPSKRSQAKDNSDIIFTGTINSDGSYSIKNIEHAGYYYIQAFSEFYIPGYYSDPNESALFWQQADSVFISGEITGYNIFLERDSSYGGGVISGKIISDSDSNFVNTIIYAQSTSNGKIYTHNFVDKNGNYRITNLPSGSYKVIGQLIDYEDAVSTVVNITPQNYYIPDINLEFKTTDIREPKHLPSDFELYQNYPNPFNPVTKIKFFVPVVDAYYASTTLRIYDILGNEIETLVNGIKQPGLHEVEFYGKNLASGVYYYQLIAGGINKTRKMVLIK